MENTKKRVLILGAGLSGLACAYFLRQRGIPAFIFEKEKVYGGLCRSQKKNGFTFDYSGHLLHFRNPRVLSFVQQLLGENMLNHKRNAQVYVFGRYIPYPFQLNFHLLPAGIARRCLYGFTEAYDNGRRLEAEDSFLQWLYKNFGAGVAENFMIPYNEKFWRVPLDELTYAGVERFIVVPTMADIRRMRQAKSPLVPLFQRGKKETDAESPLSPPLQNPPYSPLFQRGVRGDLQGAHQEAGYNASFWYPARGGIETLAQAFARDLPEVSCCCAATEIDLSAKRIKLLDGREERFDCLISSLPLPELARMIVNLPGEISGQFKKLRWNSILNLNLGIGRKIDSPCHWIYFPEKEFIFFRAGCYTNFSSSLAPADKSLLYAEVAYTADERVNKEELSGKILRDLKKTDILSPQDTLEICAPIDIKYGYVIYDRSHKTAVRTIRQYLNERSVFSIGRYGRWEYMSMEDVILDAQQAAELILTC